MVSLVKRRFSTGVWSPVRSGRVGTEEQMSIQQRPTRRTRSVVLAVVLLGLAAAVLADSPLVEAAKRHPPSPPPSLLGSMAPEIAILRWFNHGPSPLLLAGRLTLLDFWGTGCGACVASLPTVERLAHVLGPQVQVVLVHDRIAAKIRKTAHGDLVGQMVPAENVLPEFLADRKVELPVAMTDTLTFRRYTAMVVPLYVVVDAQGIIRYAENHPPTLTVFGEIARAKP